MPVNTVDTRPGQFIHVRPTAHGSPDTSAPIDQSQPTEAASSLFLRRPSTPDSEMRDIDHKHSLTSTPSQRRTSATPPPTAWSSPASPPIRQRAASIASPEAAESLPQAAAPDQDPFWEGLRVCQRVCLASNDPNHVSIEQAVGHFVAIGQRAPEQLPWLFSGFTQGLDLPHLSEQPGGLERAQHLLNQIADPLMAYEGEMGRHNLQRCLHAIALASHTGHPDELHRVDYAPTLKGADRLVNSQDGRPVWVRLDPRQAASFLYDPQARQALGDQAFIPSALGIDGGPLGALAAWANGLRGVYLTPLLSGAERDATPPLPREISAPPAAPLDLDPMLDPPAEADPVEPGPEVGVTQANRRLFNPFHRLENLKRSEIDSLVHRLEGEDNIAHEPLAASPDTDDSLADAELLGEIHRILLAWPSAYQHFDDARDVLDHVSAGNVGAQDIEAAEALVTDTGEAVARLAREYLDLTQDFDDTSLAEQIDHWMIQARQKKEEDAFQGAMETGLPREAIDSYLAADESTRERVAQEAIANTAHNQRHRYATEIAALQDQIRQENREEEVDTVEVSRLQGEIDLREILLRHIEGRLKDALWQAQQRMDYIGRVFEHRSLQEGAPALGKIEFLLAVLEGKSLKSWDAD